MDPDPGGENRRFLLPESAWRLIPGWVNSIQDTDSNYNVYADPHEYLEHPKIRSLVFYAKKLLFKMSGLIYNPPFIWEREKGNEGKILSDSDLNWKDRTLYRS